MDEIRKQFLRLTPELKERFAVIFRRIEHGDIEGFDVRRLRGKEDMYRIRIGVWRIAFKRVGGVNVITRFERRNESTYRDI